MPGTSYARANYFINMLDIKEFTTEDLNFILIFFKLCKEEDRENFINGDGLALILDIIQESQENNKMTTKFSYVRIILLLRIIELFIIKNTEQASSKILD